MKLLYWEAPEGNFGDDLNGWIWDHLLPGWQNWDKDVTLFGVGTLMNHNRLTSVHGKRILVAGTGVGYGTPYTGPMSPEWDIRALRGPLGAKALGLDEATGLIDPAIMIPEFPEFRSLPRIGRPLFVPHFESAKRHDWKTACDRLGVDYIAPSEDSRYVIRALGGASVVLAESMHAAILADAFRVPWIAVSISGTFNAAKWQDWGQSLGMHVDIRPLFPQIARLGDMLRKSPPKVAPPPVLVSVPDVDSETAQQPPPKPRQSLNQRVRIRMESAVLTSALRRAMARPTQLSDGETLQRKRDAYRRVLDSIQMDYGSADCGASAAPLRVRRVA